MSQQPPQSGYPPPQQPDYSQGYGGASPSPYGPPPKKAKKPLYKRPWFLILAVLLIIIIAVSNKSSKKSNTAATSTPSTVASSTSVSSASTKAAAPAAPKYTVAEQQAIRSAKNYLKLGSGFSYKGLFSQLTSSAGSGFTTADARFALAHIHVSYDQQAVLAAEGYLKETSFSRADLIGQLDSAAGSQFTRAQAQYAANKVGLSAAAPAPATHAPAQHSCTTTSSGSCIRGGEFCKQSEYGETGYDAAGDSYTCTGSTEHPHWEG